MCDGTEEGNDAVWEKLGKKLKRQGKLYEDVKEEGARGKGQG